MAFNKAIRVPLAAGLLLMAGLFAARAALMAGPLEEYLAKPVAEVKWPLGGDPPQITVPRYQRMFREAQEDWEKGAAIGNLSVIALRMALQPESRAAGRVLLETWVLPNLEATKVLDNTHTVGWRHSLLRAKQTYKLCGDHEAEKAFLAKIYQANAREGDKDLAVYLLAYQQAGLGNHQEAIKTLNFLDEDSPYARNRKQLIRIWTKEMNRTPPQNPKRPTP